MEIKELKEHLKAGQELSQLQVNLSLRSAGVSASDFKWENPEFADGVPILARPRVSDSDPNIKTVFDNFSLIQNTKAGYLASNIEREYDDSVPDSVKDAYKSFDQLNNTGDLYVGLMTSCAGWGSATTLCYLDSNKQVRIKELPVGSSRLVYDADGDVSYGIITAGKLIYGYDSSHVYKYRMEADGDLTPIGREIHGFGRVPLVEWLNNKQARGNAQKAVSLLDAYDRLISDNVTEFSSFRNAYLLLKDMGTIDEKTKADMQKTGVFVGTGDAKAEFITKDINPSFAKMVIDEVWGGIWVVSSSVDPKALSSLSNATAFQIGQMYRLMENDCTQTESLWNKSFEHLDRILKSFWLGLSTESIQDYSTESITYKFARTLPRDVASMLEASQRAGINLPQYVRIMQLLNVDEATARRYAEEAENEVIDALPSFGE